MTGIISAMGIELEIILSKMTHVTSETLSGIKFYKGKLSEKDTVCAVCGIGKVNAAMCTQTMILKYSPKLVINTGIAGSITSTLGVFDIVLAQAVIQYDMDTTAFGDPIGYINNLGISYIPCSDKHNSLVEKTAQNLGITIKTGIVATGDKFVNSDTFSKELHSQTNAIACEMEGGAVGQVCRLNGVPFCIIRAISDKAGDDGALSYNAFIVKASKISSELVLSYFL